MKKHTMIPGRIFKENLLRQNIALKIAAERLNISIPELQDIFLQELEDDYYYELCDKTQCVHIVPYGISLKALEKYNELEKLETRINERLKETIALCLQKDEIIKQKNQEITDLKIKLGEA